MPSGPKTRSPAGALDHAVARNHVMGRNVATFSSSLHTLLNRWNMYVTVGGELTSWREVCFHCVPPPPPLREPSHRGAAAELASRRFAYRFRIVNSGNVSLSQNAIEANLRLLLVIFRLRFGEFNRSGDKSQATG